MYLLCTCEQCNLNLVEEHEPVHCRPENRHIFKMSAVFLMQFGYTPHIYDAKGTLCVLPDKNFDG